MTTVQLMFGKIYIDGLFEKVPLWTYLDNI